MLYYILDVILCIIYTITVAISDALLICRIRPVGFTPTAFSPYMRTKISNIKTLLRRPNVQDN